MMSKSKPEPSDYDEEFAKSVAEWRDKHRLREDDVVIFLVELFRIHQRHWDELRRRAMPDFGEFRTGIGYVTEASRAFQTESAALLEAMRHQPAGEKLVRITRTAAIFASMACLLAGYLIGRFWP